MILVQKSQMIRSLNLLREHAGRGSALVLLVVLFLTIDSQTFAVKPQPPLTLTLSSSDLPDGTIEVQLEALANREVESVELTFYLPKSVSFKGGEEKWKGSIAVGEKKVLIVLIQRSSSSPAMVIGEAEVVLLQGGSFVQQSEIAIAPKETEENLPLSPPIKRKQGGETILEFKGR